MKSRLLKIKKFLRQFFTLNDSPHNIAAGFALGVFLGIIPGGVLTALVLATILRVNRASATAGVLATNMWGTIAIMPFAALIGGFLFDTTPSYLTEQFDNTYHLGIRYFFSNVIFFDLALPLLTGFLVAASAISLIAYFTLYSLLKYGKITQK
ncbi:MAG TPA: DUF2062 domain-containing protein [Candidatus Moranbacteria bacterium]|jgi:uncharacterized protein (DUF2062 family)|nr:DUF2062 domain-containing protein [Candidatus Moranbacteria bacterium]HQB59210.1 DUF2062 domain-containing protein [Candidatus Moranbacteria bacterium]